MCFLKLNTSAERSATKIFETTKSIEAQEPIFNIKKNVYEICL